MPDITKRPVAFKITITGTLDVYCENGETPQRALRDLDLTQYSLNWLMREAKDYEFVCVPDEDRNYPEELGGGLMPELLPTVTCPECGRTIHDEDGVCVKCGYDAQGATNEGEGRYPRG